MIVENASYQALKSHMPVDYVSAQIGSQHWVITPRTTARHRAEGRVCITPKRYAALQRQWEIETYGAPLNDLLMAAPRLFSALRTLKASSYGSAMTHQDRTTMIEDALAGLPSE